MRNLVAVCLALIGGLMQPVAAMAEPREFAITAAPELREAGILEFLLVRFTLKTQRRATWADAGADLHLHPGGPVPVMRRGDLVYGLALRTDNPAAARFADWITSDIGQAMIADFTPDDGVGFAPAAGLAVQATGPVFVGDTEKGAVLAQDHCGRCHTVNPATRMTGIGSSPSFAALRALPDWEARFMAFYTLNPHPALMRVKGISPPFDPLRPPPIVPVLLTEAEVAAIQAYAETVDPADLGAPIQHQ